MTQTDSCSVGSATESSSSRHNSRNRWWYSPYSFLSFKKISWTPNQRLVAHAAPLHRRTVLPGAFLPRCFWCGCAFKSRVWCDRALTCVLSCARHSPRLRVPQWVLRHHGELGGAGRAERALGESSSEHVGAFAVRRHDERLHPGGAGNGEKCFHDLYMRDVLTSSSRLRNTWWCQRRGSIVRWVCRSIFIHELIHTRECMLDMVDGVFFGCRHQVFWNQSEGGA